MRPGVHAPAAGAASGGELAAVRAERQGQRVVVHRELGKLGPGRGEVPNQDPAAPAAGREPCPPGVEREADNGEAGEGFEGDDLLRGDGPDPDEAAGRDRREPRAVGAEGQGTEVAFRLSQDDAPQRRRLDLGLRRAVRVEIDELARA
jgi:hypothetical protein